MSQGPFGMAREGFSLLEVVLALVIFQVGILGVAGMVLLGQRSMRRAGLVMRGTLEAARVGDSILLAGEDGPGRVIRPWGTVSWEGGEGGGVRVVALAPGAADTVAVLLLWPPPRSLREASDSLSWPGGELTGGGDP